MNATPKRKFMFDRVSCVLCSSAHVTHVLTDDAEHVVDLLCSKCARIAARDLEASESVRRMRYVRSWLVCTPGPAFYVTADVRAMKAITERSGVPKLSNGESLIWTRHGASSAPTYRLAVVKSSGRVIGFAQCGAVR